MERNKITESWRPEDWDNPYKEATVSDFGLGRQEVYGWEHKVFEAGADAMLEALLSQPHQNWLATSDGEKCKGRWVFIPEER